MARLTTHVGPIHFEDFEGAQFERLVFAYLVRASKWRSLSWYGQVGSDLGRDILGVRDGDGQPGEVVCVQCVNRGRLTLAKAVRDLERARRVTDRLGRFLIVCRSNVSARLRDRAEAHARSVEVVCEIWSGREFEERLRATAEVLLRRFVEGAAFPDASDELSALARRTASAPTDAEIVDLLTQLFDRPAFYTPFHNENSIADFRDALTSTIESLNTGVHRLRDGTEIRRIPSRHDVADEAIRRALARLERSVAGLRAAYDALVRCGDIRPCGCGQATCPVFFASPRAADQMDSLRADILDQACKLRPGFSVSLEPWYLR